MFDFLSKFNIIGALKSKGLVGVWGREVGFPNDVILISESQLLLDKQMFHDPEAVRDYIKSLSERMSICSVYVNNGKELLPLNDDFGLMENTVIFRHPNYTRLKYFDTPQKAKEFIETLHTFMEILYSPEFMDKFQVNNVKFKFGPKKADGSSDIMVHVDTWLTEEEFNELGYLDSIMEHFKPYIKKNSEKGHRFSYSVPSECCVMSFEFEFTDDILIPYPENSKPICTSHVVNRFTETEYIDSGVLFKDCGNVSYQDIQWTPHFRCLDLSGFDVRNFETEENSNVDISKSTFERYYWDGKEFHDISLSYDEDIILDVPNFKYTANEISEMFAVIDEFYNPDSSVWSVKVYDCDKEMFYRDFTLLDDVSEKQAEIEEAVKEDIKDVINFMGHSIGVKFKENKLRVYIFDETEEEPKY